MEIKLMELAPLFHQFVSNIFQYLAISLLTYIAYHIKTIARLWKLLIKAVQIILGQMIRHEYKQASADGWVSMNTFKRVEEMFSVYTGLNGNGTIAVIWQHFIKLEIKDPEVKQNG